MRLATRQRCCVLPEPDVGQADVRIRALFETSGNENGLIFFRLADNLNFWHVRFTTMGGGSIRLVRTIAGVATNHVAQATGLTGAATVDLRIDAVGNVITIRELVTGAEYTTTDATHNAETKHGLGDTGAEAGYTVHRYSIRDRS